MTTHTPLRNIGIMAHVDAGKTTCAERILHCTGRIHHAGNVDDGDTELDFDPLEQKHGITINAAATAVMWRNHRIQIIDTPGHVDFTIEVERSLRVMDGAIFVLDASAGVECQSETVFHQAERHEVRPLVFVNKVDKIGADFDMCLRDLRERLDVVPAATIVPIGEGTSDFGLFDVLARKVVHGSVSISDSEIETRRRALIEACAELDDEVFAAFCSGRDAPSEAIVRALRKGTLARRLVVVTSGSALKYAGISALLDAVNAYLPDAIDLPPIRGENPDTGMAIERARTDDAPLAAIALRAAGRGPETPRKPQVRIRTVSEAESVSVSDSDSEPSPETPRKPKFGSEPWLLSSRSP